MNLILHDVLRIINVLSNHLQNKSVTLENSGKTIKCVIASFKVIRSYKSFDKFWKNVQDFMNKIEISVEKG